MKNNDFYITEAFNRLKCLDEEVFDLSVDAGKLDNLREFVADDIEAPVDEFIVDAEANEENDLQDNYVGKVILECTCCHARVYRDEDEVEIDPDTGLANMNLECPVCAGEFGYNIIGKIEPFDDEKDFEEKEEVIEEPEEDVEEIGDDEIEEAFKAVKCDDCKDEEKLEKSNLDEDVNEPEKEPKKCARCGREEDGEEVILDNDGLCDVCHDDLYKESLKNSKLASDDSKKLDESESLTEEVHDVEVKTEEGDVEVSKDGDKVTVDFAPAGNEVSLEGSGEEMIAPLSDEEISDIENNDNEEDGDLDLDIEEEPEDEESIDDFDEEGFEEMGESYLKRVYENVKSFKVNEVKENENKGIIIEGLITFESGKESKTSFVFENAKTTKRGKTLLEGHNSMFSKSNKAFMLKGLLEDKKFVCESLTYNYNASSINEANESETIKVYGRVAR